MQNESRSESSLSKGPDPVMGKKDLNKADIFAKFVTPASLPLDGKSKHRFDGRSSSRMDRFMSRTRWSLEVSENSLTTSSITSPTFPSRSLKRRITITPLVTV